jgi:hypothetical protein
MKKSFPFVFAFLKKKKKPFQKNSQVQVINSPKGVLHHNISPAINV